MGRLMFELMYLKNRGWHAMLFKSRSMLACWTCREFMFQWMDEEFVGFESWSLTKSCFRHLSMTHVHIHLALAIAVFPKRVSVNIFINTIYEYNVADVHAHLSRQPVQYTNTSVLTA